jgi:hypothetical protein
MNDLFIDFNFSKSYISNNTEFTSELKSMKWSLFAKEVM